MQININSTLRPVSPEWQEETLLNVLREHFGLVGTKFGCGTAQCGACTVHIDGQATRSCIVPIQTVGTRAVTSIEGLASKNGLHPVQLAWLNNAVPQCGYCQAGQVMAAVALLNATPKPSDQQIDAALEGNLCRCGTQQRIRNAIKQVAGERA
jgi:isoquinoline 1-oxidoreductase subunit alpha